MKTVELKYPENKVYYVSIVNEEARSYGELEPSDCLITKCEDLELYDSEEYYSYRLLSMGITL